MTAQKVGKMKIVLASLILFGMINIAVGGVGLAMLHMTRAEAVIFLTKIALLRKPELASTPTEKVFADIENLPADQQHIIELARAIHITAGTTATTFSPYEITPLWQWAILYGKMVQVSRH